MKKIPLRMCIVTRESLPKGSLLRIVNDKHLGVHLDLSGNASGRGAYLKKDISVIEKARKSGVLNKALRAKVPDEIYDELIKNI